MSAPYRSISASGATTFPFDFDILCPSLLIIPCVKSRSNGSWKPTISMSASAFTKKRAYIRCRIACSTPPMYWSTGIHSCTASWLHGASSLSGSV